MFAFFLMLFLYYTCLYYTYDLFSDKHEWTMFVITFELLNYTVYVFMLFTIVRYFIRNKQKGIEKGNDEGNERL